MEVTANTTWRGVKLVTVTNMETGQMQIYTPPTTGGMGSMNPGTLLAETKKTTTNGVSTSTWEYSSGGADAFRSYYNSQNPIGGKLTKKEFNSQWYSTGQTAINKVRTKVLSNSANYTAAGLTTPLQVKQAKENHFVNGIPGATQNGITINNDGTRPTQQTTGEPPDSTQSAQTLAERGFGINDTAEAREQYAAAQGKRRGGSQVTYRYPKKVPEGFEYDYIKITAHDYVASGLDNVSKKGDGGDGYFEADKNLGPPYETVIFPMQPQLSETNAVNWSDDQLNPVQAMLGNAAVKAIGKLTSFDLKGVQNVFSDLYDDAKVAMDDPATLQAVAAYFAGQAVGANLQGRLTGNVINPNLELLFNGPQLRTFQFNFRLTPRTEDESKEIRKIIRCFKRNMAVNRTSSNLFLTSPRLFKLVYIYKDGGQHPYLNKFKPCAMSNFQVNYTPDGSYATFDKTGSLTAYDLTMSFSEVMPIYASDFDKNDDNPKDMGY